MGDTDVEPLLVMVDVKLLRPGVLPVVCDGLGDIAPVDVLLEIVSDGVCVDDVLLGVDL
jgi:hypothetical protein